MSSINSIQKHVAGPQAPAAPAPACAWSPALGPCYICAIDPAKIDAATWRAAHEEVVRRMAAAIAGEERKILRRPRRREKGW